MRAIRVDSVGLVFWFSLLMSHECDKKAWVWWAYLAHWCCNSCLWILVNDLFLFGNCACWFSCFCSVVLFLRSMLSSGAFRHPLLEFFSDSLPSLLYMLLFLNFKVRWWISISLSLYTTVVVQGSNSCSIFMQEYGHRVRLATHRNFKEFVLTAGLEFYPLGGDPKVLAGCK